MELLTFDSSIFVAALREPEEKHHECKKILENLIKGKYQAIEPYSVLVEVSSAVKRRTKSEDLARKVMNDLLSIDALTFIELVKFRAQQAADLALKTGLRSMDALVVQVAKENNCALISLDIEMLKSAKGQVKIKDIGTLL